MLRVVNPTCQENDKSCLNNGAVVGWGVGVLTVCAILNISTRKYTMGLNNLFAVTKLAFVVVITFLGIAYGTINGHQCRNITWAPQVQTDSANLGDVALAVFYAIYPYTGYEQPFYVLAEVLRPQQTFAKSTMCAMATVLVLFPFVNVTYLYVNPYTGNADLPENMAIAFIERISGARPGEEHTSSAVAGVSFLLAFFIFGNLMAQTYTASRVEQEVAKDGILPWSLVLATGNDTLLSRVMSSSRSRTDSSHPYREGRRGTSAIRNLDRHHEQAPFAATALHWFFEVVLLLAVGLTAKEPSNAYGGLTYIYTFVIVGVLGLFTAGGVLYLKIDSWV